MADAASDAARLAEEHEALIQFLYIAPIGLAQCNSAGDIVMANPISAQLLLPLASNGQLDNLFEVLADVAPEVSRLAARFTEPHGMICDTLHIALHADPTRRRREPQVLSLTLLKLDDDRLMAVLKDVSESVRRERQLRQSQAWFNAILTGVADYALVSLDSHGRIDDWNASIGRVTGFAAEQVVGQAFSVFCPEDASSPERVDDVLREADRDGWSLDDGWRLRADGSRFWGSAMVAPASEPAESGAHRYNLIIRDITDKRDATEALRRAATCDDLTGVCNRRAFFEAANLELDRWRRAPRPLALLMFDADHFKAINDTHGHHAGDVVLRRLATTLLSTFRSMDVVARVGGEEFAVLLPSTDLAAATAVANRLVAAVAAQTVDIDGTLIRYTVSGGVAVMDKGVEGLDDLMKRADLALYVAKAQGRNCIRAWAAEGSGVTACA